MTDSAPSAIAQLRSATWPLHQRLEKRIDFKSRIASRENYRLHLQQMWGFYAALEPRLCDGPLDEWLGDCAARRKLPMLERDLAALGVQGDALAKLARCTAVPASADTSAAFGCAYVMEGATLGGRSLMPVVEARLGLTAAHGAAFLASYGEAVAARWQAFGAALERCCASAAKRARAAEAAVATFAALEVWLCGAAA